MNNIFLFREVFSRFSSGKSISASKIHDKGKYPVSNISNILVSNFGLSRTNRWSYYKGK